jgi:CheY-like chemotaxis protein
VEIDLSRVNNRAEIRVSDSGEGISADFMPYIFDRFRQADSSVTRSHGGLGIGLALVKQFVELHRGRVRASSDGKGLGASFVIELPLADMDRESLADAPVHSNPERNFPNHPVQLRGIRVLVIDDEPDALEMVCRVLEDHEAFVGLALSADAALTMLAEQTFDILISDIGMPFCDGYALLAEIHRRGFQIPAIALTAFARREDKLKSQESGYQIHLCKPVEIGELLSAIESLTWSSAANK